MSDVTIPIATLITIIVGGAAALTGCITYLFGLLLKVILERTVRAEKQADEIPTLLGRIVSQNSEILELVRRRPL